MEYLQQAFSVKFEYKVYFTENLFAPDNKVFSTFLNSTATKSLRKLLFVIDSEVNVKHPHLQEQISGYMNGRKGWQLIPEILIIPGGEQAKNSEDNFYQVIDAVNKYGIDRHSYIVAIGGGSVLDVVGYAAAVSHRGVRHIRIPTTVLSQNDSGVGVKNGINYSFKKNFLGTFAPPVAVFNDFLFLTTLPDEEWRSGMAEAVKVALIKDKDFYLWLKDSARLLAKRNMPAMKYLIQRCAELHMEHIGGGDPFELGSSRPLDFGHWSAHKLEQLSNFTIRHGEAVAMGIVLDSAYSYFANWISEQDALEILKLIRSLGFAITHPLLEIENDKSPVMLGLSEFREHLGGELTIMLLSEIGKGEEVHELETPVLVQASKWIKSHTEN